MMTTKTKVVEATLLLTGACLAAPLGACDDEGETEPATAASASSSAATTSPAVTTSVGSSGGEGGAGTGGSGGTGGAGTGGAGTGGGGGTGGEGGATGACLAAADVADLLALEEPTLCAVARYDAPAVETSAYGALPTWGRHGGLLWFELDTESGGVDAVTPHRLSAPPGASGELADAAGAAIPLGLPAGSFAGAQLVDLWDDRSALAYTGTPFDTEGGVVIVDERSSLRDVPAIGPFGVAPTAAGERLLTTSLSAPGATSPLAAGLHAATRCDEEELCAPTTLATWGDATGPLALDAAGNAFAVMTSFDGTQSARGWSAAELAEGAPAAGTELFELGGFGSPLAALAPEGGAPGWLVYQATDGTTFLPLAPIAVAYEIAGAAVAAASEPTTFLTPAEADAPISLTADDEGRLWIGVPRSEGGTTFVVVARR